MIVDTSALIGIVLGEPEERAFKAKLESENAKISAGTLIETRIVAARLRIRPEIAGLIATYEIATVPVDQRQSDLAAAAFERYGKGRHAAGLNFGDLFAYALAKALDEPLLFKGDDFARTDVKRAI
jgi:ribonuclease VapC